MTKQTCKRLLGTLFFFGILALTFWYVFRDENLGKVLDYLTDADIRYVLPAMAAVVSFILGESLAMSQLLHPLGAKPKFYRCCLISFVGFFYSAITPSASGGQPMQLLYMRRDGVPGAVSTVVLAIITIAYKLVLVVVGLAVLLRRPPAVMACLEGVMPLMYLGVGLNVVFVAFLLTAVFHPAPIQRFLSSLLGLLNRIHCFRDPERVTARLNSSLDYYRDTSAFFKREPMLMVRIFLITLAQRFCLFSVIWFTYRAFGLSGQSVVTMILLQAMISVAVDMLPLPGGMGISETLFLTIFQIAFGPELVLPGMIVCRGISYYAQLLISGVMTGAAHLVFQKNLEKKGGNLPSLLP